MGCTLLLQDLDLIITTSIAIVIENIGDSTIYISLTIGVRNWYGKSNTISNLWIAWYKMIVNEISIVKLEMISNMEKQLAKVSDFSNSSMAVFGGLFIIIIIGNFY